MVSARYAIQEGRLCSSITKDKRKLLDTAICKMLAKSGYLILFYSVTRDFKSIQIKEQCGNKFVSGGL
jgi:hypothetical protein